MDYSQFSINEQGELETAFQDVLADLNSRVIPAQNNHWDFIRCEIWEDSGRLILFPSSQSTDQRIDVSGSVIVCNEIAERVQQLDDSDLTDDCYEKELTLVVNNVAIAVSNFFQKHKKFKVKVFNQDGHQL